MSLPTMTRVAYLNREARDGRRDGGTTEVRKQMSTTQYHLSHAHGCECEYVMYQPCLDGLGALGSTCTFRHAAAGLVHIDRHSVYHDVRLVVLPGAESGLRNSPNVDRDAVISIARRNAAAGEARHAGEDLEGCEADLERARVPLRGAGALEAEGARLARALTGLVVEAGRVRARREVSLAVRQGVAERTLLGDEDVLAAGDVGAQEGGEVAVGVEGAGGRLADEVDVGRVGVGGARGGGGAEVGVSGPVDPEETLGGIDGTVVGDLGVGGFGCYLHGEVWAVILAAREGACGRREGQERQEGEECCGGNHLVRFCSSEWCFIPTSSAHQIIFVSRTVHEGTHCPGSTSVGRPAANIVCRRSRPATETGNADVDRRPKARKHGVDQTCIAATPRGEGGQPSAWT
ncbi:hypothetical protein MRB53_040108 [Persea americana]|nr:hypothetical protein MRB53_040108 [Persea americana]